MKYIALWFKALDKNTEIRQERECAEQAAHKGNIGVYEDVTYQPGENVLLQYDSDLQAKILNFRFGSSPVV